MKKTLSDYLHLSGEQEEPLVVIDQIKKGVIFSGTNLWVLVFAIFVASVGLNVNSTAVIIGAMLISPLMGPIMGLGFGLGTYDLALIKKSILNLGFAIGTSLIASTLYFFISPLNEAHSELFARTSPNIYDVLIAFFGGLAGIIAITSKQRGNSLQGAAIATALMPPLCTAGFGIATNQWEFFFGAFYLFIINSVFISLATYIMVRSLKFKPAQTSNPKFQVMLKRIIISIVFLTLIPSIYLGYHLVQKERFLLKATQFIDNEFVFENTYLLSKKSDFEDKTIQVVLGGKNIDKKQQNILLEKLKIYGLEGTQIKYRQTLSFQSQEQIEKDKKQGFVHNELLIKQKEIDFWKTKWDSLETLKQENLQLSQEIKAFFNGEGKVLIFENPLTETDSISDKYQIILKPKIALTKNEIEKLKRWLFVRLKTEKIEILFAKPEQR